MTVSPKRARTTRSFAALAAALALTLAGCASGGAAGGDPAPEATRTSWPQPVDGRLTTDMCDLLGPDDYRAAGAIAAKYDERELTPRKNPTALSCHSVGQNWLTLSLQPDARSGEIYYAWRLHAITKERPPSAEKRENVVPGADASYVDAADEGHHLMVRRGGLIVGISMGFLNDGLDQYAAMTKLASLVLQRTQAGTTDTGEPHHMTMTVTARPAQPGPVNVQYVDPNTNEMVKEQVTALPWTKKVDFAWYGSFHPVIQLDAYLAKPTLNKYLSCTITIDGKKVAEELRPSSFATCSGGFSD